MKSLKKMTTFLNQKILLSFYFFVTINIFSFGQQDPRINQLLNEKRKAGSGIIVNDKYKIQIYSGEMAKAKDEWETFKKNFKNYDATITFQQPNYKVWVGSFKSKIEAEKALAKIKKTYPNCLLINNARK